MAFNSIDFAVFLPIVFVLYWCIKDIHLTIQNCLIVIASYIFYAFWDWRFLSLLLFSTIVDYTVGIKLQQEKNLLRRKILLWISILVNIGILAFFKYCNFFIDNFVAVFSFFGKTIDVNSLNIIIPVGISFYTFQTLSYTIDVYRRQLEPTKNFIAFSAFVSFFPQLVAGPIERGKHLLPQFFSKRVFDYKEAVNGMRQILWGLFKKIVIADNCATFANLIFNNYSDYCGSTLLLGAIFFSFQIYGDFSGYSDIAIGTARLFGFHLKQNFNFPYFSRDIAEFWRRWHISLSTWFRDYLYIPLGGSRCVTWMKIRNTFIIFIVSGFWHGANWTFIFWGGLHAIYFLPLLLTNKNRIHFDVVAQGKYFPTFKETCCMLFTFTFCVFAWIFFRSESIVQAINYISEIFSSTLFSFPDFNGKKDALKIIGIVTSFMIVEWFGRDGQYAIEGIGNICNKFFRCFFICFLMFMIYFLGQFSESVEFIYFQF